MKHISGFTLIELLVVISIIGSLSALLVPNFMGARERARDAQRKSDTKQIQKALELYKADQPDAVYPTAPLPAAGSTWSAGSAIYINKFPAPPNSAGGSSTYQYTRNSTRTYTLCACLENTADSDGQSCPSGCSCTSSLKCYYVNQP